MFIWNQVNNGVDLNGVLLLSHPETGKSWPSEADALRWWQASDYNHENEITETIVDKTELMIESIQGALQSPNDVTAEEEIKIVVNENEKLIISGSLAIEDTTLYIPFRRDDGRTLDFVLSVVAGKYTMEVNFPSMGRYMLDTQLLDQEYSASNYQVKMVSVRVLRASTTTSVT